MLREGNRMNAHGANAILEVKNLTKTFVAGRGKPPFVAVNDISFTLQRGEVLGLLGTNGAGKTTTIQMLLSTLTPSSGSISYFGKDFFAHRSECLQKISFASTYINLPSTLTVQENLFFYGTLYGFSRAQLAINIQQGLERFGIEELRYKKTGTLSAGQKTRLMLCKAFLTNPEILLLDEPTASLDPAIAHEVRDLILQQQRDRVISVLFTSHNMDEVAYVCNRILVLSQGSIIANDTPKHLAASVRTSHVKLVISNGLTRTINYVKKQGLPFCINERSIKIDVDEDKIAQLLNDLAKDNVCYTQIAIEKPTLEDYFLRISQLNSRRKQ